MSEIVEAPQPEAGGPTLKLSQSNGASGWTLKVYDALWEAAQEGRTLTRDELISECVKRFNRSATLQWWQSYLQSRPLYSANSPYPVIVERKMQSVLHQYGGTDGVFENVGSRKEPRYTITTKKLKVYVRERRVPGHFAEYDPETKHDAGRQHTARLAWRDDARRALEAKRPTGMKELVERAIDLFFEQ